MNEVVHDYTLNFAGIILASGRGRFLNFRKDKYIIKCGLLSISDLSSVGRAEDCSWNTIPKVILRSLVRIRQVGSFYLFIFFPSNNSNFYFYFPTNTYFRISISIFL